LPVLAVVGRRYWRATPDAESTGCSCHRSSFVISNRDSCFDHIVISLYASIGGVEKPCRRERLNVRMDIAVVAPQGLRQRPHAGHFVPADVMQQFHPLSRHEAGESVPTLEREMTLVEGLPLALDSGVTGKYL